MKILIWIKLTDKVLSAKGSATSAGKSRINCFMTRYEPKKRNRTFSRVLAEILIFSSFFSIFFLYFSRWILAMVMPLNMAPVMTRKPWSVPQMYRLSI